MEIDSTAAADYISWAWGNAKYGTLTVQFTPHSGVPQEQKIEPYLSAQNWERVIPGASVRVWHAPATGHTFLEDDIQRWNRDKRWVPLLPIGISLPIIIVCLRLSHYRVGVHDDGREYLTWMTT